LASERLSKLSVVLVLVGDGPDRHTLERLAASLAPGRVVFAGHQSDPLPWLAAADIFAFSSHVEGLPGVLIEALASGLPCIATNIPGNSELVLHRKTGLLVPVRDPAAFSDAIAEFLENPVGAGSLGQNGARRAQAMYDQSAEHEDWRRLLAGLDYPRMV
jgi:glycosyltransferase involved in cell wall biosynthesis